MRCAIIRFLAGTLCLLLLATPVACDRAGRATFGAADGGTISLRDYRGKWLLINYWAQWCAPCREEIPELNRLAAAYGAQVAVLGVNVDAKQGAVLQAEIQELDIRFPVLLQDPGPTLGWPPVQVVPTTRILDPRGQPHRSLPGPQTLPALLRVLGIDSTARPDSPPGP